jgi:hypothetical protein
MSPQLDLTWDNFRSTVFVRGQQRVHRVAESPCVEVFGDGVMDRIGLWIEVPSDVSIPPELSRLESIATRKFTQDGRSFLEVATAIAALHRQFFHFATAVAERVLVDRCPAMEAVALELQCFTDLLQRKTLLGLEREIGLLGELLFLERLVRTGGGGALDSWLGPTGEPHDFRVNSVEFEVKTTLAPHRVHTIHGAEQLVASQSCSLYLVSVLLGPPGATAGFSLADKVAALSGHFDSLPGRLTQFETALTACGFHTADSQHYTRRYAMRRPLGIVRVDSSFPAITRPIIQRALESLASRIESLQYEVNIEGLEQDEGTAAFEAAIPAWPQAATD